MFRVPLLLSGFGPPLIWSLSGNLRVSPFPLESGTVPASFVPKVCLFIFRVHCMPYVKIWERWRGLECC